MPSRSRPANGSTSSPRRPRPGGPDQAADPDQPSYGAGPAADLSAEALAGALATTGVPAGVDVAVVDLGSFLDAVSSRLPALARASAVRRLHQDLVTWGRTRPDLVSFLVESLTDLGLAAPAPTAASLGGVAEPVARLRNLAEQSVGDVVVEVSREDLDTVLVWVEEHLGQDG